MYAKQVLEALSETKASMGRPTTHDYLENFIYDMARKGDLPIKISEFPGGKESPTSENGRKFATGQQRWLEMSDAYLVDAEMMQVVRWAAMGLEDTDQFTHDLWPSDYGFLVFEEPIIEPDRWGHNMVTKAISWGRYSAQDQHGRHIPGVLMSAYVDSLDMRDEITTRSLEQIRAERGEEAGRSLSNYWATIGRYHVNHIGFIPDGRPVGPPMVEFNDDEIARRKAFVADIESGEHLRTASNPDRLYLALLMLMGQSVSARRTETAPPKAAARFAKRKVPHQITVITLRRIAGASRAEGESHVEWAHRWIVKGHWRNQPYRGDGGSTVYRKIWIAPFLKGPEDKPLKVTDKVYRLSR